MQAIVAGPSDRIAAECDAWIKRCSGLVELHAAHKWIILRHGSLLLDLHTPLANRFIQCYARYGSLDDAARIFATIRSKDVVSWNAMLSAYARTGHHTAEAKLLFDSMPDRNLVSWNTMLSAYVHAANLQESRTMFDRFPERDIVSWNSLLAAYAQRGQMDKAQVVFHAMPEKGLITWNTLLAASSRNSHLSQTKLYFDTMPERDLISWNTMMNAYTHAGHSRDAKRVFDAMPARDIVSWNGILIMYGSRGEAALAREVFEAMPYRDLVCWNVMVSVYAAEGRAEAARELFDRAPERDIVLWNAMLSAYARAAAYTRNKEREFSSSGNSSDSSSVDSSAITSDGDEQDKRDLYVEEARVLFDAMPDRNVVSWTTVVTLYAQNRHLCEAKLVFDGVPEKDTVCWNAILAAYAQAGDVERATAIFSQMPERNVESTNAMLAMFFHSSHSGSNSKGKMLLWSSILDGTAPDEVTFVHVLFGCSHSGGLSAALRCFGSMALDFGLAATKQQYSCIIDLMARAGHLRDASELMGSMPFVPDSRDWTCLLDACRSGKKGKDGALVAKHAFKSDPKDSALYVLSTTM